MVKYGLIAILIAFSASFAFFNKEAIACEGIRLTHFNETSSNVYIDDSLTSAQQSQLRRSLAEAYQRVKTYYGRVESNPRIIATTDESYGKFGLNLTGMQSSGFFRECIFLGPKGLNVDVVAHELVHAEVRHRSDLVTEFTELPAWFIEGTAISVDYRVPFVLENIEISNVEVERIKSIFYLSEFPNTSVKSYQAARVAMVGFNPKDLYPGLVRLNNGEKFETVFKW